MLRFLLIRSNLICIATTTAFPPQCTSATVINDPTRSVIYGGGTQCDTTTLGSTVGWFRFTGSAGTGIVSFAVSYNTCNTEYTGWYNGSYPLTAGATTTGTICYSNTISACAWSNPVSVTYCNGYDVYYLMPPPTCPSRVCIF